MSPLLERDLDGLIAQIRSPLRPLGEQLDISVRVFIAQVKFLCERLPEGKYALNLCGNRYLFLLTFCAVIVRRQTNLLPPNKNVATQSLLSQRYPDTYIIYDAGAKPDESADKLDIDGRLNAFNVSDLNLPLEAEAGPCPEVNDDHLCAISFTSGSTGDSAANLKYWRTLRDSSKINVDYMVPSAFSKGGLLATVPGQHMWGLETSILNVMFSNLCVSDTRPLFAKDIQNCLAALPTPRLLVSTPVHLRALVGSGLEFPKVERVLCATAPLSQELAQQVETLFGGELCEIYGCSEAGSMAYRRSSETEAWNLFEGFHMVARGSQTEIRAEHLPAVVLLQDVVKTLVRNRFELCGRQGDMVEIAGKRGSLQEMNQILLGVPGILDGLVFLPSEDKGPVSRLVAILVAEPGFDKRQVAEVFRDKLDEAFVPRSIYTVDTLPREESGKLSKKRIEALWRSLVEKSSVSCP